jgi:hypothetical protein
LGVGGAESLNEAPIHLRGQDVVGVAVEHVDRLGDVLGHEPPIQERPHVVENSDASLDQRLSHFFLEHRLQHRVEQHVPVRGGLLGEVCDELPQIAAGRFRLVSRCSGGDETSMVESPDHAQVAVQHEVPGALLIERAERGGQHQPGDPVTEQVRCGQRVRSTAGPAGDCESLDLQLVRESGDILRPVQQTPAPQLGGAPDAGAVSGDQPQSERPGEGVVGVPGETGVPGAVGEEHGCAVDVAPLFVRECPTVG